MFHERNKKTSFYWEYLLCEMPQTAGLKGRQFQLHFCTQKKNSSEIDKKPLITKFDVSFFIS